MNTTGPQTIDEYIASFPQEVRMILQEIRLVIREAAPQAEESFKYQMPTFTLAGNLVSFGAYKRHIGMYPAPEGEARFNQELSRYRSEKSTLRFPLDQPIPYDLIRQVVRHLIEENLRRAEARKKAK